MEALTALIVLTIWFQVYWNHHLDDTAIEKWHDYWVADIALLLTGASILILSIYLF